MGDGFGVGEEKMWQLIEIYKAKAMALDKYYDPEAIVEVYKRGLADALNA